MPVISQTRITGLKDIKIGMTKETVLSVLQKASLSIKTEYSSDTELSINNYEAPYFPSRLTELHIHFENNKVSEISLQAPFGVSGRTLLNTLREKYGSTALTRTIPNNLNGSHYSVLWIDRNGNGLYAFWNAAGDGWSLSYMNRKKCKETKPFFSKGNDDF
jgi:hypothetical protein